MTDQTGFTINRGSGGAFTLHQDSTGGPPLFSSTAPGAPLPDPPLGGAYQLRGVYVCGNPNLYTGDAFLQLGGPLAGVAATPLGTASFWVNLFQVAGTGIFPWTGNTTHTWSDIDQEFGIDETNGPPNTNQPFLFLDTFNVANPLLNTQGPAGSAGSSASPPPIPPGKWYQVLLSWNTNHASGSRIAQCYVNDAPQTMTPITDVGAAFSTNYPAFVDTFGINQPSGTFPMGDVWFAPGAFLDLTVTANRRKFIDGSGNPVFLGDHGEIPLGVPPAMFFTVPPLARTNALQVVDPRFMSAVGWANAMTQNLSVLGPIPRLTREEEWRKWASTISNIPLIAQRHPPAPAAFEDWHQWAHRFNASVRGMPL